MGLYCIFKCVGGLQVDILDLELYICFFRHIRSTLLLPYWLTANNLYFSKANILLSTYFSKLHNYMSKDYFSTFPALSDFSTLKNIIM